MRARHEPIHELAPPPSWRIFRAWGASKDFLGIIEASNKESAIRMAIRTFEITDPAHQKHLVAEVRD
jgi:hypothetical protein